MAGVVVPAGGEWRSERRMPKREENAEASGGFGGKYIAIRHLYSDHYQALKHQCYTILLYNQRPELPLSLSICLNMMSTPGSLDSWFCHPLARLSIITCFFLYQDMRSKLFVYLFACTHQQETA